MTHLPSKEWIVDVKTAGARERFTKAERTETSRLSHWRACRPVARILINGNSRQAQPDLPLITNPDYSLAAGR
jgi:hypothetical protein